MGEVSERTEEAAVDPEEDALLRLAPGPGGPELLGLGMLYVCLSPKIRDLIQVIE